MDFQQQKKFFLSREDKSKKGSMDKRVKNLVKKINSFPDFYTTSSCAGRIMIYEKKSAKKFDTNWIFVSHEPANFQSIKKIVVKLPKSPVWFREEPMILHVCGKNLDCAQKILDAARLCGFKRSGIMATKKRVMVEFTG